jgi:ribosomal protein S18 acetylase RimI-like enzyme
VEHRPFESVADLRAMQALAQEVWRLAPQHIDVDGTVGELAWAASQHVGREHEWKRELWFDGDVPVAWGWIFAPASLLWQTHPERPELLDAVLDWFEASTEGPRDLSVALDNAAAVEVLRRHDYHEDPDGPRGQLNVRDLDDIEEPQPPDGYVLTTMREFGDYDARVDIHRVVWDPSRVTTESYANVRRTWPYRDDLDCVLVAPDGSLAAYTLAWYDDETRVGEFEPVGVHPNHRRLGLGRSVNLFGLHRLREAGATTALVACSDDDANNPGPKALYRSVGFRTLSRSVTFKQR